MTNDEAGILRLIDAIKAAQPHIDALTDRVIDHCDRAAFELLDTLDDAATAMIDHMHPEGAEPLSWFLDHPLSKATAD